MLIVHVTFSQDPHGCSFYLKTGSCKYGDLCGKRHSYPASSKVILIKHMYDPPNFGDAASLEYEEEEEVSKYREFLEDVYPEFRKYGYIAKLYVCRNFAPHLRGNVYVQYETEENAMKAVRSLSHRYYAGKLLHPEFSPVSDWHAAICGHFRRGRCHRGNDCNFLHVYDSFRRQQLPRKAIRHRKGSDLKIRERPREDSQRNQSRPSRDKPHTFNRGLPREHRSRDAERDATGNEKVDRIHRQRHEEKGKRTVVTAKQREESGRGRDRDRDRDRDRSRDRLRHRGRERERGRDRRRYTDRDNDSGSGGSRNRANDQSRNSRRRDRNREKC